MRGRQNGVRSCVELAMQGVFREQRAMSFSRNIENFTPAAPELSVGGGGKRPWLDGLPACEEPPVRKKKPHPHLPGWKQSIPSTKSTGPDYFLPSAKLFAIHEEA